jgi:hypothetical protein
VAANVAVRLLQVHFAIAILISGFHKLQFGDWWAGAALWYPLHPPFRATVEEMRAHAAHAISYLTMLSLATYAALAWQITFPLFAWRPRLRVLLLAGAAIGLWGTAYIYELPMFGPVMVIGCLSYLTAAEWRRVSQGLLWAASAILRPLRARRDRRAEDVKLAAKRTRSETLVSGRRR